MGDDRRDGGNGAVVAIVAVLGILGFLVVCVVLVGAVGLFAFRMAPQPQPAIMATPAMPAPVMPAAPVQVADPATLRQLQAEVNTSQPVVADEVSDVSLIIDADGALRLADQDVAPDELAKTLGDEVRKTTRPVKLTIHAHASAPYNEVSAAVLAAKSAGITQLNLRVSGEAEEEPSIPAPANQP